MRRFEVTIESVFYREEGGTARLAFRGKASSGTWAGYKTFFADECHDLVDGTTGLSVTDVSSWLFGLQDDVIPMTLLSLANAIIGFLEREFGIDIGEAHLTLTDAGTTLVYGKITSPDEKPPFENLFVLLHGVQAAGSDHIFGVEPIVVRVSDTPEEQVVETTPEAIITTTYLPVAVLECIPCAGSRIDVRNVRS